VEILAAFLNTGSVESKSSNSSPYILF